METYSVVWTINIEAPNAEKAAQRALEIQRNPESIATIFHVCEDVDSQTMDDGELIDRGYQSIDVEEIQQQEVSQRLQAMLCARWNKPAAETISGVHVMVVDPDGFVTPTFFPFLS